MSTSYSDLIHLPDDLVNSGELTHWESVRSSRVTVKLGPQAGVSVGLVWSKLRILTDRVINVIIKVVDSKQQVYYEICKMVLFQ